ncbi:MAG: hypothetical protein WC379_14160 [Methanoregula sp.]|jgi:hypothetical protein
MKTKTLIHSSVIAAIFVAAVIGVGLVTEFPGAKPFISVDPLSDKNAGDQVTIAGTTNLPAGTELMIQVYATSFETHTSDTGEFSGAVGTVDVMSGTGEANTWSMDVDTSVFAPMEYLVNASVFTGDVRKGDFSTGSPFGTTTFTVRPATGTAGTSQSPDRAVAGGILIDPILDTPQGVLLEVTGKTNLSVGTDLLIRVVPGSMQQGKITGDYLHPESVVMTKVVKGSGVNNRFSASIETVTLPLADHIVTVSDVKGNAAGINSIPGTITGTEVFNIIAGTASTSQAGITGQYIEIDPIAEKTCGDLLIVSGSTNLPAGTTMIVQAGSSGQNTVVIEGKGGVNRYSVPVDTSIMKPGTKTINVSNMIGDPGKGNYRPGTVNMTTTFILNGTFLATETLVQVTNSKGDYIHINPIGDRNAGDQFLITATTSLPVGTEVLWQVMPDTGIPPTGLDGNSQMSIGGNSVVTKSDGTENRISLAADMSTMVPQKYAVIVGKPKRDQSQGPPFSFEIGDLYGTAFFTLK